MSKIAGIIIVVILFAVAIGYGVKSAYMDTYTIDGTVEKKWIDMGADESFYLVRIDDNRMLEVDRNLFYGSRDYNPDIVFTDIEVNKTYEFTCWGWQVDWGFIYWYPNVLSAKEI
jgi:hypothetical protein